MTRAIFKRRAVWIWPVNVFHIHGTMCCPNLYKHYYHHQLTQFLNCYDAKNIYEANVLILWGSLSPKLLQLVKKHQEEMLKKRAIIHIKGCALRLETKMSSATLASLPIDFHMATCDLSAELYKKIIYEARQCLIA